MHVYEIQPIIESKDRPSTSQAVKYSYLALCQRKLVLVPGSFLHPFQPSVFGSPLLLRIRDLEGYTGKDLYAFIWNHMRRYLPNVLASSYVTPLLLKREVDASTGIGTLASSVPSRKARREGQHRQKTTVDMECFSAGKITPFGFHLRLVSRDGSRCALCSWYSCCVGCLIPCDDFPVIASCGDSLAIDWHLSMNISSGGFGWDVSQITEISSCINVQTSPHDIALMRVKKHSSFHREGGKKYGYSGSITLEECLDSFSKEEKVPEVSLTIALMGCISFLRQIKHYCLFFLYLYRYTAQNVKTFEFRLSG